MNHVQRFGVFGIAWIVCVFAAYSQLTVSSPDIYKPSVKTDLRAPAVPLHPFRSLCFNDTEPNAAVSKNIKDKQ